MGTVVIIYEYILHVNTDTCLYTSNSHRFLVKMEMQYRFCRYICNSYKRACLSDVNRSIAICRNVYCQVSGYVLCMRAEPDKIRRDIESKFNFPGYSLECVRTDDVNE